MFEEKFNELKRKFIKETRLSENMLRKSMKGFIEKDINYLKQVIEDDETKLNAIEMEIDELCVNIIALYQPEAMDLRSILMILKMNNDLERIGDLAVNISQSILLLTDYTKIEIFESIKQMFESTILMFINSIDSFMNNDTDLARTVCIKDQEIDTLRNKIINDLIIYMKNNPQKIEYSLYLIKIARDLERIADLSTNICEDVIFMVNGITIKHNKK